MAILIQNKNHFLFDFPFQMSCCSKYSISDAAKRSKYNIKNLQ